MATAPRPTLTPPTCERLSLAAQRHVLRRAREKLNLGYREPGLLYLGGRLAASLGLDHEARAFLTPLGELLRDNGRPTPAFFPVGLLTLRLLPAGAERDALLAELLAVADGSKQLTAALGRLGLDPRQPASGPARLLHEVQRNEGGRGERLHATAEPAAAPNPTAEATRAYTAGDMPATRRWLERALLERGDRPEVLRNLITVTSELRDATANDHYWRRYVKVLLADAATGGAAGWGELARFYARVAAIVDPALAVPLQKVGDVLRRPGLLPRWLEAHAALAWLDPAGQFPDPAARTAMAGCWLRVFYPEFAPFVVEELMAVGPAKAGSSRPSSALGFDPGERLLTRLLLWARVGYGLKGEDASDSPHAQAVAALAELAVRVPAGPHSRALRKVVEEAAEGESTIPPVRRALQDAFSTVPRIAAISRVNQKPHDWVGVVRAVHRVRHSAHLAPAVRLLYALGLANTDAPADALEHACRAAADFLPTDTAEKAEGIELWEQVLFTSIEPLTKRPTADRRAALAVLRERIEGLPDGEEYQKTFRTSAEKLLGGIEYKVLYEELLKAAYAALKASSESKDFAPARAAADALPDVPAELKEQKDFLLLQIRVGEAMKDVERFCKAKQWAEARRVLNGLPGDTDDMKELKANYLDQVASAERMDTIEKVLKTVQRHCEAKNWKAARAELNTLPDAPADVKELKANWLKQVADAEESDRVNTRAEAVMKAVQRHCDSNNWRAARAELNTLPDTPAHIAELKRNVRGQIDRAEENHELNELMEDTMKRVQAAVNNGDLWRARNIVDALPDHPEAAAAFKRNLQNQLRNIG